ncbi:MAG: rRNA maturation RNase YbeY [Flavisolibacter sp.]
MTNTMDKVTFHYVDVSFYFPKRTQLKSFLLQQLRKEGRKVEALNYVFCTDEYLLTMNQQYLQHDTLTDIITFELSPKAQPLVADIYISVERVRENALTFRTSFKDEILRVIFHGALHLSGYKDKTSADTQLMRKKEEEYLGIYSTWNIDQK